MNMKKILMMVLATLMATVAMISCSNDDSPVEPAEQVLQDLVPTVWVAMAWQTLWSMAGWLVLQRARN